MRGMQPAYWIAQYVLRDADTPTPSRRVATLEAEQLGPAAKHRHTTPVGLRRLLRGDLDWIVLKAIDHDRARRYDTANALASDITRHLENKPVVARPPTLTYTAAKFVRRHRLAVSVLATAAVALIVGITSIARERNRAELEAAKARAISGFLQDMLQSADPWQGGARQTTVAEALQAGVQRVTAGSIADPLVAASIKRTIGGVYLGLGQPTEADTLIRAALAERLSRTGPSSVETAESYSDLGGLYVFQGKVDSAVIAYERALEIYRRRLGSEDTLVAGTTMDLADATADVGNRPRADSLADEALRILRGVYGERHPSIVNALGRKQGAQLGAGNLAQAESTGRAAVAMLRDLGRERDAQAAPILNDLALTRMYQGDNAEALALMHQVVALDTAVFGTSHPYLAAHLENLGLVYQALGYNDSTRLVVTQGLDIRRAVLGSDNPAIGRSLFNLATIEYVEGRYAAAEPLYEQALPLMRRAYGAEHNDVVYATGSLGRNQFYLGRKADAERNIQWALAVTDPAGRLDPVFYARFGRLLVTMMVEGRRWKEAEPLAVRVLAIQDSLQDTLARITREQLAVIRQPRR
jgi:tetratricopeptide (TPR) repeat protein